MQVRKCLCCKQSLFGRAKYAKYCKSCGRHITNIKSKALYQLTKKKLEVIELLSNMINDKKVMRQIRKIIIRR